MVNVKVRMTYEIVKAKIGWRIAFTWHDTLGGDSEFRTKPWYPTKAMAERKAPRFIRYAEKEIAKDGWT